MHGILSDLIYRLSYNVLPLWDVIRIPQNAFFIYFFIRFKFFFVL